MDSSRVLRPEYDTTDFEMNEISDDEIEEDSRPPTPILKPKKIDSKPNIDALESRYKRELQEKNIKRKVRKTVSKENIPEYDKMTQEDQDEWRAIFKGHFMSLSSDHPKYDISYPGDHESLTRIHLVYLEYIKQIYSHMNAEDYRVGLIVVLAAIELFGTKYLKMPFAGFTQHQIQNFDRYRSLLVKMGEENWSSGSSNQPAFVQIMMFGVMQLVLFGAVKFLSQYIGGESIMSSLGNSAINMVVDSTNATTFDENGHPTRPDNKSTSSSEGLINTVTNLISNPNIMDGLGNILNQVGLGGNQSSNTQKKPKLV